MIWKAKVDCQFQRKIYKAGETVECPKKPNEHFELVSEDLPDESASAPSNTAEGNQSSEGQVTLNLNTGNSGNPGDDQKGNHDSDLDGYNKLVDVLQNAGYSFADLPDRKQPTIIKFLQEKGLM